MTLVRKILAWFSGPEPVPQASGRLHPNLLSWTDE